MARIRERLFLGDKDTARDPYFMVNNKIVLIVNATVELSPNPFRIHESRVPVNDDLRTESIDLMTHYIPWIVQIIYTYIKNGNNVLVHCYAGRQRSAVIVASYLMLTEGMSADEAVAEVRRHRPIAFTPQANFYRCLTRIR